MLQPAGCPHRKLHSPLSFELFQAASPGMGARVGPSGGLKHRVSRAFHEEAWVVVPQDSGNLLTSWALVPSHIITELSCGGKSLSPPPYTATGEMPEVQTFYTGAWAALLPLTFLISLPPFPLPIILRTDRTLSLKLSLPPRAGTNTLLLLGPTQWPAEGQDLRAHPELCHQQGLL